MTSENHQWLLDTAAQAKQAGHIWPEMAACEAALESAERVGLIVVFGASKLAREANNLFGMKQHAHPIYGTLSLPTKEVIDGRWVPATADWVKYPTVKECFEDRMETLRRLAPAYPHYRDALAAPDATSYIQLVSQTWSTDPQRAEKVLAIYNEAFPQPADLSVQGDV